MVTAGSIVQEQEPLIKLAFQFSLSLTQIVRLVCCTLCALFDMPNHIHGTLNSSSPGITSLVCNFERSNIHGGLVELILFHITLRFKKISLTGPPCTTREEPRQPTKSRRIRRRRRRKVTLSKQQMIRPQKSLFSCSL